jgi:DDE superfamily endonuclease
LPGELAALSQKFKSKQDKLVHNDRLECLNEVLLLAKQGHIDLYYGGESGFSLNCVVPYCWQFDNENVEILPQKGKAINVLGFMNSVGNQVQAFSREGPINAEFVIQSVNSFVSTLTKMTVLVLDNARIHHSKIFQEQMEKWENSGLYILYLPAYSPYPAVLKPFGDIQNTNGSNQVIIKAWTRSKRPLMASGKILGISTK